MTFPLQVPAHYVISAGGERTDVIILVLFLLSEPKTSIVNRFRVAESFVKVGLILRNETSVGEKDFVLAENHLWR